MRPRNILLVLVATLLILPMSTFVNAEETPAPVITEQAATNAPVSTEALDVSVLPNDMESYSNVCGDCSVSICRGAIRGTYCGSGKWCIPTNTLMCPGTDEWDCQCARNYN